MESFANNLWRLTTYLEIRLLVQEIFPPVFPSFEADHETEPRDKDDDENRYQIVMEVLR